MADYVAIPLPLITNIPLTFWGYEMIFTEKIENGLI